MYESHWKFRQRPFEDGAAPEFYYPSRPHQTALLKLRYLVEQRKGIGLIVGEHGLGKSYLTHVLEGEMTLEGSGSFCRLSFPSLTPAGMLAYLAGRLGLDVSAGDGDHRILAAIENQLEESHREGNHIVFVIDDAHVLEMAHLHQLRLLLNLRENGCGDFSIILSGRTELLARLTRLAALEQRVVVRAALEPLSQEEILPYLNARLAAAGREQAVFSEQACRTLWELSQGIPRRINQLCDLALLVGYVDELQSIGPVEIEAAAQEMLSVAA